MLTVQADLSGSVMAPLLNTLQTQRPMPEAPVFPASVPLDRQCPFCTHSGQQGNTDFVHRLRLALIYQRNLVGFITVSDCCTKGCTRWTQISPTP